MFRNYINRTKLTREEKDLLVTKYQNGGDPKALDVLLSHHLAYIIKLSIKLAYGNMTLKDDLIQEGVIGFIEAMKTYKTDTKMDLLQFAVKRIKIRLHREKGRSYSILSIGTSQHSSEQIIRIKAIYNRIVKDNEYQHLTRDEIINRIHDIDKDKSSKFVVARLVDSFIIGGTAYLDKNMGNGDDKVNLYGLLNSSELTPEQKLLIKDRKTNLENIIEHLSESEKIIFDGVMVNDEKLGDIGKRLGGVTGGSVCQLKRKMISNIKSQLSN